METDVTDLVQRYRLALRHIWNCCIWVDPALRTWDSVYSFRALHLPLFKALIADPLGLTTQDVFGDGFHVVADKATSGDLGMIQVNSRVPSSPSAGVWMPLKGALRADDFSFTLINLFDWSPLGYIDLRYYVVRIDASATHPETVGQHALIDVGGMQVIWTSSAHEESY